MTTSQSLQSWLPLHRLLGVSVDVSLVGRVLVVLLHGLLALDDGDALLPPLVGATRIRHGHLNGAATAIIQSYSRWLGAPLLLGEETPSFLGLLLLTRVSLLFLV